MGCRRKDTRSPPQPGRDQNRRLRPAHLHLVVGAKPHRVENGASCVRNPATADAFDTTPYYRFGLCARSTVERATILIIEL
jgi:hypothetical protein